MKIELHAEAARELEQAAAWYEAQQPALGAVFLREISRAFDVISENPRMWPVWPGMRAGAQVRRFVVQRFPFSIAYIAQSQRVLVIAVAHSRRRPRYWRARTRKQ